MENPTQSLKQAIESNDITTVELAIQHGAALDGIETPGDESLLMQSLESGQYEISKLLIEHGADVRYGLSEYPLHLAAGKGYTNLVEKILAAGEEADALGEDQVTPLMYACSGGHLETEKCLLEAGASAETWSQGTSPLIAAAAAGSSEIVSLLMERQPSLASDLEQLDEAIRSARRAKELGAVEAMLPYLAVEQQSVHQDWLERMKRRSQTS